MNGTVEWGLGNGELRMVNETGECGMGNKELGLGNGKRGLGNGE